MTSKLGWNRKRIMASSKRYSLVMHSSSPKALRKCIIRIRLEETYSTTKLDEYGFSSPTEVKSSAGNLMHWLSGTETQNQNIHVDVFKLPHHGSQVTSEPILFHRVSALVYLIGGSSANHGHPTRQILHNIIKSVETKHGLSLASAPSLYRSKENNKNDLPNIKNVRFTGSFPCQI